MSNLLNFLGDYDTLTAIAKKVNRLLVVDFFATWCGPCKALGENMPQIAKQYPNVVFLKVDIDQNKELATRFGVQSVPHVKFLRYQNESINDLGTINGCDVVGIRNKINELTK
ncbi:Thioredoxin family protein [Trichomonas vaginalis G3]|uniref:Thioredoxin family protein n=1 Tax=Trichomonas vaginalis (strain ATCC PRA-98 / G3) TaxID=412133 RepID=A2FFZ0_TRIV3|nr:cell redox homeostasis [Trichomonas vaginalis G3]EAX96200.1 Thioredoxin family protein [Trichomonas vaginalis G3]KAI5506290.1 cell redox homeostasis [Trichomonas vaginalis G3]|eukprot:XP_001309130.1 Thioredoxin family protein [Trichomonas vaginalis G3]